jgi:hypothetical protein
MEPILGEDDYPRLATFAQLYQFVRSQPDLLPRVLTKIEAMLVGNDVNLEPVDLRSTNVNF